jgi:hypothetical protein
MAARIHRQLEVIAFNANEIWGQRYELSKQLKDLHIDMALHSATISNSMRDSIFQTVTFHRTDRFPERKDVTAIAVRKGIPHKLVDLPPLVSIKATGICIPIGNSEVLLPAVYAISPQISLSS